MNLSTFLTFADDLSSYRLSDIEKALMHIASVPRREGETSFPEIATIFDALRGVIRMQRAPEPTSGERWASYADKFWKNPPAPLDAELESKIAELNAKYDLKKPREIETVNTELVCPKCQFAHPVAGNLRSWTAKELHEYAGVVEQLEVIAARNRSMSNLPLGDVVAEVSA